MKMHGSLKPSEMKVFVGDNLAGVQNYETGKNTNVKGKALKVSIRATGQIGHRRNLQPVPGMRKRGCANPVRIST